MCGEWTCRVQGLLLGGRPRDGFHGGEQLHPPPLYEQEHAPVALPLSEAESLTLSCMQQIEQSRAYIYE